MTASELPLTESDELIHRLLDFLPIPIICNAIIGYEQEFPILRVDYLNRAFKEVIGYSEQEIPNNLAWLELAYPDPEYRAEIRRRWVRELAESRRLGRDRASVVAHVRCRDGSRRWFEIVSDFTSKVRSDLLIFALLDQTHLHQTVQDLELQARTDDLTGLANRRWMQEQLAAAAQSAERGERGYGIILCDIDRFKEVNDTHGHACGDALIMHVAAILRRTVGGSDIAARWGGDEFLLLLPGAGDDDLLALAERLCKQAMARDFIWGGRSIGVTLSVGCARHRPGAGVAQTIARADAALYRAKSAGRNQAMGDEGGA